MQYVLFLRTYVTRTFCTQVTEEWFPKSQPEKNHYIAQNERDHEVIKYNYNKLFKIKEYYKTL